MRSYRRVFVVVILFLVLLFLSTNLFLYHLASIGEGRPYRVEINRIALSISENGPESISLADYKYVTAIVSYTDTNGDFYTSENDYFIREINGILYRFDYSFSEQQDNRTLILINIVLAIMAALVIAVILYIRIRILSPFDRLKELPYELSKGHLTAPITENKNRYFGRFLWGVNLLREKMEAQKQHELALQKDKKMLLLSLSHDIKTPLSAIKLYAKALSKGLYSDTDKQLDIADNINAKADEIEGFVSQIIQASREDFLEFDVNDGEFYLSELMDTIRSYYREKLSLIRIDFTILEHKNCLLRGDLDRSVEVLQNIIENAIKYGDGQSIEVQFEEEDGCQLITVKNSGCTLTDAELVHIFDSFWRGSNTENKAGSGLGLYICRQLMLRMNGDIFAQAKDGFLSVTTVFSKIRGTF